MNIPRVARGSARARRIIHNLMMSQLDADRHAIVYGTHSSLAWVSEVFTTMKEDPRLHRTRCRWCNLGIKSPRTGFGCNSVVRLLSSLQLWGGPTGRSAYCRCTEHATQDDFLEDGPRHARFFEAAWRAINGYVLAQAFRHARLFQSSDLAPRATLRKPARVPSHLALVGGDQGEVVRGKVLAFPTEQRRRQKAKKEAGHVAKKPQIVEDHHDDW